MDRVRVGVLGTADFARRRMLPAMAAAPGVEVVALASRDAGRAAALARQFDCRPVLGYAALLEIDEVSAVYVPLPAALHAVWVEAALRAGKHVLAEKPLTTDPARTRRLLRLARDRGLVLAENILFRQHSQHAEIRRLLAGGAIGTLRSLHASFAIPRRPDGDIRYRVDLGGGALWDVGVYPVSLAQYFLGTDLEVVGAVLTTGAETAVDIAGAALLRTADGVDAQLSFGLDHSYRSTYTLWGSGGSLTVDRAFTPAADHRPVVRLERPSGTDEIRLDPDDQVIKMVAAFAGAVRGGTGLDDDCVARIDLLDQIRQSARVSGRIGPADHHQPT